MHYFYFNECIPEHPDNYFIKNCLEKTLKEYKILKDEFADDINGIITSKLPHTILFCDNYSLIECMNSLEPFLKRYAYSVFNKYPIENYLLENNDVEQYLKNDYTITVDGKDYDALYPYIISQKEGVLFSLAVHRDLEVNHIKIMNNDKIEILINNLYGCHPNTQIIRKLINEYKKENLSNFEHLLSVIGEYKYSDRFRKGFEDSINRVQCSIIETFKAAIARGGPSRLFADDGIVKDVTPEGFEYKVFELRVKSPVAYRIYFYETKELVYLALAEKKPPFKEQSDHIKSAKSIIKTLVQI